MRKTMLRVLMISTLAMALLPSCDTATNSDSSSDGSGTGGGQSISFFAGTQQYVYTENLAAGYTPGDDETCVVGSDAAGALAENAIHIYFSGNAAGTFTGPPDPDPATGLPRIGILIDASEYYAWEDGEGCWFSIDVSTYGPVGGRIEGTFAGELVDGSSRIQLTDGTFSVMRYE